MYFLKNAVFRRRHNHAHRYGIGLIILISGMMNSLVPGLSMLVFSLLVWSATFFGTPKDFWLKVIENSAIILNIYPFDLSCPEKITFSQISSSFVQVIGYPNKYIVYAIFCKLHLCHTQPIQASVRAVCATPVPVVVFLVQPGLDVSLHPKYHYPIPTVSTFDLCFSSIRFVYGRVSVFPTLLNDKHTKAVWSKTVIIGSTCESPAKTGSQQTE